MSAYLVVEREGSVLARSVKDYEAVRVFVQVLSSLPSDFTAATWRVLEADSVPDLNAKLDPEKA